MLVDVNDSRRLVPPFSSCFWEQALAICLGDQRYMKKVASMSKNDSKKPRNRVIRGYVLNIGPKFATSMVCDMCR